LFKFVLNKTKVRIEFKLVIKVSNIAIVHFRYEIRTSNSKFEKFELLRKWVWDKINKIKKKTRQKQWTPCEVKHSKERNYYALLDHFHSSYLVVL